MFSEETCFDACGGCGAHELRNGDIPANTLELLQSSLARILVYQGRPKVRDAA